MTHLTQDPDLYSDLDAAIARGQALADSLGREPTDRELSDAEETLALQHYVESDSHGCIAMALLFVVSAALSLSLQACMPPMKLVAYDFTRVQAALAHLRTTGQIVLTHALA